MGWKVRYADGSLSAEFATWEEAEAHRKEAEAHDPRTPEEIWDAADRPRVGRDVFLRRMRQGWKTDRALNTTMEGRYSERAARSADMYGRPGVLHDVLGRSRTLREWSESCGISERRLLKGVKEHGTLQKYLLLVGWYPFKDAEPVDLTDI